jgi:TRAP-type uncharacterized transport system substrate-binding protein
MTVKRWIVVAVAISLVVSMLLLPACQAQAETVDLQFTTGTAPDFVGLGGWLESITFQYSDRIRISPSQLPSDEQSLMEGYAKLPKDALFMALGWTYWGAKWGQPPWEQAYPKLRIIGTMGAAALTIITTDPDVKTTDDLAGKTFAALAGSVTSQILYNSLEVAGIRDQVNTYEGGYDTGYTDVRDGLADANFSFMIGDPSTGYEPDFFFQELIFAQQGRIYQADWLHIEDFAKKFATGDRGVRVPVHMPDGTTVNVLARLNSAMSVITTEGFPEDVGYELAKLMVENIGEAADFVGPAKFLDAQSLVNNMPIRSEAEVDPGALRYYKEVGLWDNWLGPWDSR